jgi:hypothetical protein
MARRGSFGARPRVAQSLTSTIVSIEREMQQRRDSNLMDAWKNGGVFEGKQVTDAQVEKYWTEREKNLDKKDPLYDTYHSQIMQLQYGIAQSKADLANKQGKLSDAGYASFYLNWSKKVAKNSEFYRTLQKDAAILIENSKAKAADQSRKNKLNAFNAFVKHTADTQINVGNALKDAAVAMAQASGLDLEANGDQVMSLLTQDIHSNPAKYKGLTDALKIADPNFVGSITPGFFAKEMQKATDGYTAIADRSNKDGYASNYAAAIKGASEMATMAADIKVWPVGQAYDAAYNVFVKVWQDPNATELDRNDAARQFAATTGRLAKTADLDPVTRQMLQADSTRLLGGSAGDTLSFSNITGRAPIADSTGATIKGFADKQAAMDANPGAFVYAPVDANGQYDNSGKGGLGIVPAGAVGSGAAQVVVVGLSGKAIVASIEPHPIYAVDPQDASNKQIVGYSVSYNNGGKRETQVSYKDATGQSRWTSADNAPWATGVKAEVDNHGDTYLFSPPPAPSDLLAQAKAIDTARGTHLADLISGGNFGVSTDVSQSYLDKDGAKITVSLKNGRFSGTRETTQGNDSNPNTGTKQNYDLSLIEGVKGTAGFAAPWQPADAVSPSRLQAGALPGVTFASPLAASMGSAEAVQAGDQAGKLFNDPVFQQSFLSQTMAFTGAQNPLDPRVVDAWKAMTTPKIDQATTAAQVASSRSGLTYPGQSPDLNKANQGAATIKFGAQSIKVPNLPSYVGQQNADLSGLATIAQPGIDFFKTALGIGAPAKPPLAAAGAAAAAKPPTLGPPPPMPTPTSGPTPTPPPTPTPAAAPIGLPNQGSRPGPSRPL